MRVVKQTTNKCCGQACLATITGFKLERVLKILGGNPTPTSTLVNFLSLYSNYILPVPRKLIQTYGNTDFPFELAILKVSWNVPKGSMRRSHWVVYRRQYGLKYIFDPLMDSIQGFGGYLEYLKDKGRITSYLIVKV